MAKPGGFVNRASPVSPTSIQCSSPPLNVNPTDDGNVLVPVKLIGRDLRMPLIYQISAHPLLSSVSTPIGRIYIGSMPASNFEEIEKTGDLERTMKCPPGGEDDWVTQGTNLDRWTEDY